MTESPFYTGDKYYMPEPKPKSPAILGIVGSIVGMLLGRYTGINFVIPAIFMGLAYLLYRKLLFKEKQLFFLEASVVLCGHAAWVATGLIFLELNDQGLDALANLINIVELSIYIGFSFFLLKAPNFGLAIALILIEVIMIVINTISISDQPFASEGHKALTAHLALRAAIVFGLLSGLKKMNNQAKQKAAQPEASATEAEPKEN